MKLREYSEFQIRKDERIEDVILKKVIQERSGCELSYIHLNIREIIIFVGRTYYIVEGEI